MTRKRTRYKPRVSGGLAITKMARELLGSDLPTVLKQKIFLASKGILQQPRRWILCSQRGHLTRVWIPEAALTPVDPQYDKVQAYWVCEQHMVLDLHDPQIVAALARRKP